MIENEYSNRESIWSVAREAKRLYFTFFVIQIAAGLCAIIWNELWQNDADGVVDTGLAIWSSLAPIVIASAAVSIMITELWRGAMVISEGWRLKNERRKAELLRQGREEERAAWAAWYQRWLTAKRENRPFDEPPPTHNGPD